MIIASNIVRTDRTLLWFWSENCCLYEHILFLQFVNLVNRENCFTLCHQPKTQLPKVVMHPLSACIIIYSCILHSFCIIISSTHFKHHKIVAYIISILYFISLIRGILVWKLWCIISLHDFSRRHEGWWATCNWIGQLRLGFRRIWRKDLSKNSKPDESIVRLIGIRKRGVDGNPS